MRRWPVFVLTIGLLGVGAAGAEAMPMVAGAVLIRQPGALDHGVAPGSALLRILARSGEPVREARLDASSGDAAFDARALSTVQRWRYVPALMGNSPEPEWLLVRFVSRSQRIAGLARAR